MRVFDVNESLILPVTPVYWYRSSLITALGPFLRKLAVLIFNFTPHLRFFGRFRNVSKWIFRIKRRNPHYTRLCSSTEARLELFRSTVHSSFFFNIQKPDIWPLLVYVLFITSHVKLVYLPSFKSSKPYQNQTISKPNHIKTKPYQNQTISKPNHIKTKPYQNQTIPCCYSTNLKKYSTKCKIWISWTTQSIDSVSKSPQNFPTGAHLVKSF